VTLWGAYFIFTLMTAGFVLPLLADLLQAFVDIFEVIYWLKWVRYFYLFWLLNLLFLLLLILYVLFIPYCIRGFHGIQAFLVIIHFLFD
jgi:hypothetical protein